jgi:tRNA(adenine34) deaminase
MARHPWDVHMAHALAEARAALDHGDVPVGAVVVRLDDDVVVAARHNERELRNDPTAHAEMLALRDAAAGAGTWRLDGHALVVTLEPCPMCAGAAWAARIPVLVYGAADPKAGAAGTLYNFSDDPRLNHTTHVVDGIAADAAGALLTEFFGARRREAIP